MVWALLFWFSHIYYGPPMKLWEGNVFSRVCHSVGGEEGLLCTGPQPPPPIQRPSPAPTPLCTGYKPPGHVQTCSTWTSLYKTIPLPRNVQTCSLWSTDCQKVGGCHSTEMPSCYNCWFFFSLLGWHAVKRRNQDVQTWGRSWRILRSFHKWLLWSCPKGQHSNLSK